jgi:hypothetical protein
MVRAKCPPTILSFCARERTGIAALAGRDQAFASVEEAYAAHDPEMQELVANPRVDRLHLDTRFDLLLSIDLNQ